MFETLIALCLSLSGLGYFSIQSNAPLEGASSKPGIKIISTERRTPLGQILLAANRFTYEDINSQADSIEREEYSYLRKSPDFIEKSDLAYQGRKESSRSSYKKKMKPLFICKSTRCRPRIISIVRRDPIGCGPELGTNGRRLKRVSSYDKRRKRKASSYDSVLRPLVRERKSIKEEAIKGYW